MKELVEDDLMGYNADLKVLYARFELGDSVSLGDRYGVPKSYIPSGVAEVANIDRINLTCTSGVHTFWFADLKAVIAEPDNPCDEEFMEEISS
jgi:hypothetical protein